MLLGKSAKTEVVSRQLYVFCTNFSCTRNVKLDHNYDSSWMNRFVWQTAISISHMFISINNSMMFHSNSHSLTVNSLSTTQYHDFLQYTILAFALSLICMQCSRWLFTCFGFLNNLHTFLFELFVFHSINIAPYLFVC